MQTDRKLGEAFVALADTLVDEYEVLDFLYLLCDTCSQVLAVDAVGVMLTGEQGVLELCAASTEDMRVLELFEMQQREGPCQDAYHEGRQVTADDLRSAGARWPKFVPHAVEAGFGSVYALPLRLRGDRIGALNAFRRDAGTFDDADMRVGQALADVATIGIMQERAVRGARERSLHLQSALDRRVPIEQAKGIVAERLKVGVGEAFELLRRYARNENRSVVSVAQAVVDDRLRPEW